MEAVGEYALLIWLVGGLPTAMLVGPFVYSALKHRVRPTVLNCSLAGALVAATPWLAFLILASLADLLSGVAPRFSGEPTLVASIAVAGALGGLVFRGVVTPVLGRESPGRVTPR